MGYVCFNGADGNAHSGGDFLIAEALFPAHFKHLSSFRWQLSQYLLVLVFDFPEGNVAISFRATIFIGRQLTGGGQRISGTLSGKIDNMISGYRKKNNFKTCGGVKFISELP